jgi:YMGG-like Gly-zipper
MRVNAIFMSALLLLAGCTQVPLGPSVAVMPTPGKPFDLFVSEENLCRNYAEQQVGISPQQATQNSTVTGAVAGTALGAAAGGAIGAAFGSPGPGAAVGAGTGLLTGSAVGANAGYGASWTIQRRYDIAYEQCMYAKGNQIPGFPITYAQPPPLPSPPSIPPPPS